jgi:hypothetical protein
LRVHRIDDFSKSCVSNLCPGRPKKRLK